jgi:hypothetical protein
MNPEPLIGITTHASRIVGIEPCIRSLLNQSVRPKKIVLSIPKRYLRFDAEPVIPDWLAQLQAAGSIEIHRPDDIGPATKLLGPWEYSSDPNQMILWADDDGIYNPKLIECLVQSCDDGMAVGASGIRYNGTKITHYTDKGFNVDLLQGYAGVVCRRKDMPNPLRIWQNFVDKDPKTMGRLEWSFFLSDDYIFSEALKEHGTVLFGLKSQEMNELVARNPLGISMISPIQYNPMIGGIHSAYSYLRSNGIRCGHIL